MVKLFIVGIPRDLEEVELIEMFTTYGQVHAVKVITDQFTGISKGYGFVDMIDEAGAERAISALDGAELDERVISVRLADSQPQKQVTPAPNRNRSNQVSRHSSPNSSYSSPSSGYSSPNSSYVDKAPGYSDKSPNFSDNNSAYPEKKKRPRRRI